MYEIVVACNQQMVIGKDNTIPWKIKEDLKNETPLFRYFISITLMTANQCGINHVSCTVESTLTRFCLRITA